MLSGPGRPEADLLLADCLIIVALVLLNGVFSGAEIALVSLRASRLQELKAERKLGVLSVLALRAHPERFLATIQVGISLIGASAAAYGGSSIATQLEPLLEPLPWIGESSGELSIAIVVLGITFLSIVLGELVPKSLALHASERYALLVSPPLQVLSRITAPLVQILTFTSNLLLRPFGDRTNFLEAHHTAGELAHLIEESSRAGALPPRVADMTTRALEFAELRAEDVMVPRTEVVMLPRRASTDEISRLVLENVHSRLPVYDGSIDNIVGYVSIRDFIGMAWERDLIVLEDLLRPAVFVPETARAIDVLHDMRSRRMPLVIVVDEQGGMSGILTLEDLVEELVGEIFDEHARGGEAEVVSEPGGSYRIQGRAPMREVNRLVEPPLPQEGNWTTLAGLFLAHHGHIPENGASFVFEDGRRLEVLDVTHRRIRWLRLHPAAAPQLPPS
ncbi:MAG: HlyC/CorC family transporter [Planctomycetes bacterium]|nr:HlyC/CorC family transporter [Planctomycetota bacterium]